MMKIIRALLLASIWSPIVAQTANETFPLNETVADVGLYIYTAEVTVPGGSPDDFSCGRILRVPNILAEAIKFHGTELMNTNMIPVKVQDWGSAETQVDYEGDEETPSSMTWTFRFESCCGWDTDDLAGTKKYAGELSTKITTIMKQIPICGQNPANNTVTIGYSYKAPAQNEWQTNATESG